MCLMSEVCGVNIGLVSFIVDGLCLINVDFGLCEVFIYGV